MTEPSFTIGFVLFPGLTPLDLVGPWEVLNRLPEARCLLAAETAEPVSGGGLTLTPHATFDDCPKLGMLCVPGGEGHLAAMENQPLLDFLRRQAANCRLVTSVCTGALVLAAAGLLDGYRATTHWMSHHRLEAFGVLPTHGRVVEDRDRITGGGVTAGIDFALMVVAKLAGEARAKAVQLQIEYAPVPPFEGGTPETASPELIAAVRQRTEAYRRRMAEVDARILARRGDAPT